MNKKYTRKQIIESISFWQKKLDELDDNASDNMIVESIVDFNEIQKILPIVIDMVVKTYIPIGGYYGNTNVKSLLRSTSLIKVVKNVDGNIAACSFYRNVDGSYKIQAYAYDSTKFGKNGVKAIIKFDTAPYDNWVWGEISGNVEKYFKKFEGYPLPNEFVIDVLNKSPDSIKLLDDGFHYRRKIADNTDDTMKVVYGFQNKEIADEVFADANYQAKRQAFNLKSINESESNDGPNTFKGACSFVNQLSELYDEEDWRQLTPGLSSMLDTSIDILKQNLDKAKWVNMTLTDALYLREHMPEITLVENPFK